VLSVIPVFVVLDESDCVIALCDNSVVTLEAKQACGFVYIYRNIVKTGSLPRDLQTFLVELKGLGELFLLKVIVSLLTILVKSDGTELLLNLLLSKLDSCVLSIHHHGAIEVLLGLFKLIFNFVTLSTSLQELDLESVVLLELLGVWMEIIDELKRSVRPLQALIVVLSFQVDDTDVGNGILV
jgi:hypothetical protein